MTDVRQPLIKGFISQVNSYTDIFSHKNLLLSVLLYLVSKGLHSIIKIALVKKLIQESTIASSIGTSIVCDAGILCLEIFYLKPSEAGIFHRSTFFLV